MFGKSDNAGVSNQRSDEDTCFAAGSSDGRGAPAKGDARLLSWLPHSRPAELLGRGDARSGYKSRKPSRPIRFFTAEEAAVMQAVVGRVMPQEDRTVETRIPILPGLDERLFLNRIDGYRYEDMPSDQDAYRFGAKAIEAMAQELHAKPFHTLPTLRAGAHPPISARWKTCSRKRPLAANEHQAVLDDACF